MLADRGDADGGDVCLRLKAKMSPTCYIMCKFTFNENLIKFKVKFHTLIYSVNLRIIIIDRVLSHVDSFCHVLFVG